LWVFNFSLIFLGFGNSILQFPLLSVILSEAKDHRSS
jgi:hypothetical protein